MKEKDDMQTARKLPPEEVQVIEGTRKGPRRIAEEQYDGFLSEFAVGDYGEAELGEGEKRLTVRNRLKAAAARRNVAIDFKRIQGDILRFQILAAGGDSSNGAPRSIPAVVSAEPPPPPKRKGGRPRKTV
jgi:hypothetical protein